MGTQAIWNGDRAWLAVACMAWGEEELVILLPRRCYDWLLLLLERLKEGRREGCKDGNHA